ncbi:MAG: dipeptide epimerase [Proteobacteria bacterium]|nr:dipeptide epimerase [Pseudomonadota bacterium]
MAQRTLEIVTETFSLARPFHISRGVKESAGLIRAAIGERGHIGEGECCPYPRYGETVETVLKTLEDVRQKIEQGLGRIQLQKLLPPGAARNALDCALWDLEAKIGSQSVADLTGFSPPRTFSTMRTVVIGAPENMAKEAAGYPQGVPLKVKLDMENVPARLAAIKKGAPGSPIIIDANEGWDEDFLESILPELKSFGVILLEQPLPAGKDEALRRLERLVPVCADEACHASADLPRLTGLYDAINIKLDKTGGLTGALALFAAAKKQGFKIMLGCMVSSALSIAPISHLCSHANYIDLDGPLLLAGGGGAGMSEVPGTAKVKLNAKWGRP